MASKTLQRIVIICLTLTMASVSVGLFLPRTLITTHPDLETNAQRWKDFWFSHPLGKLYNLYHDANEVGLYFSEFDLVQPPLVHYDAWAE